MKTDEISKSVSSRPSKANHHKHTAARYQNRSSEPNTYHFKKKSPTTRHINLQTLIGSIKCGLMTKSIPQPLP
jgi:hypothetical protein